MPCLHMGFPFSGYLGSKWIDLHPNVCCWTRPRICFFYLQLGSTTRLQYIALKTTTRHNLSQRPCLWGYELVSKTFSFGNYQRHDTELPENKRILYYVDQTLVWSKLKPFLAKSQGQQERWDALLGSEMEVYKTCTMMQRLWSCNEVYTCSASGNSTAIPNWITVECGSCRVWTTSCISVYELWITYQWWEQKKQKKRFQGLEVVFVTIQCLLLKILHTQEGIQAIPTTLGP